MTYISGLVNEFDLTYLGGWHPDLQEIFGINPVETDTLYPKDVNYVEFNGKLYTLKDYATVINRKDATIEGVYKQDFYKGTPAVTSHSYKNGKAYYIGGRLDHSFHQDFYQKLMDELSIKPVVSVKHEKGVSVQVRQDHEKNYIFVMNFTEQNQVVFFDHVVKDLITGEELSGNLDVGMYEVKMFEQAR